MWVLTGRQVVSSTHRPHVSAALAHLRFGVTLAALTLSLALVAQVGVWCFVHFTEVRVENVADPEDKRQNFEVVTSPEVGTLSGVSAAQGKENIEREPARTLDQKTKPEKTVQKSAEPIDPNVVSSANDARLRSTAGVVQAVGILAALMLVVLMLQGVVVAGGGGVPGVEMAVSGATWSLIIGLLATPLNNIVPSAPFTGVFMSYDVMVSSSEAFRAKSFGAPGPFGFYMMHVVLPLLMLGGVAAAGLRFRAGIEQGVIATSVSEAEERIEREIRSRKRLGEAANTKAAGALTQTMGQPYVPASGATGVPAAPAGTVAPPAQPAHPVAPVAPGQPMTGVTMPVAPAQSQTPPPMQGGRPV